MTPAPSTAAGACELSAEAVSGDQDVSHGAAHDRVSAYPDASPLRPGDRRCERVVDLKVAPVRVGYVMGSGDLVPDAIRRMGLMSRC